MGNYQARDRSRERRDQALRFQPPDRVSEEYNRGPTPRNDFAYQSDQSMERPDFKKEEGLPAETKIESVQDAIETKNGTDIDGQNLQVKPESGHEMGVPLVVPPGKHIILIKLTLIGVIEFAI